MKLLFSLVKGLRIRYTAFISFQTLASVVVSAGLMLTMRFQGNMAEAAFLGDTDVLAWYLMLVAGILAVRAFFAAVSAFWETRHTARTKYKMRQHFMAYFLDVPLKKIEKTGSGTGLSVYTNDLHGAAGFISGGVAQIISSVVFFFAALSLLFIISVFYTLILLGVFIVMIIVALIISQPIKRKTRRLSELEADVNQMVNSSIRNLPVITTYTLEDVMEKRFASAYSGYLATAKSLAISTMPFVVVAFLVAFGPLAVISVVLAFAVINGDITIAEFIAYVSTIRLVTKTMAESANDIGGVASLFAEAKRFMDICFDDSFATKAPTGLEPIEMDKNQPVELSFNNVNFAYSEGSLTALENVSFTVKPGEKIAIVGESGSGKSTILKLMMGLYEPASGHIGINGQDMASLSKTSIKGIYSYVPQDSFLFPGTIEENIVCEDSEVDIPRLVKACNDAGLKNYINMLPEKYESVISELSKNISGGERQRIAIARALYKSAPVMLCDEATSSLDPNTEAELIDNLIDATKDKTVVIVTHRAKLISFCETIIVMKSGKICGMGSHDSLMQNSAAYRNLYSSSMIESE